MSLTSSTDYAAIFTPKSYVDMRIGNHTIQVCPTLTVKMPKSEKAYGYLVTKSAIFQTDASICAKLTAFGQYTDTAALVEIILSQFGILADKLILDAKKLKVVSHHASNGKLIHNCQKANNQLKSVDNMTRADRRPANV